MNSPVKSACRPAGLHALALFSLFALFALIVLFSLFWAAPAQAQKAEELAAASPATVPLPQKHGAGKGRVSGSQELGMSAARDSQGVFWIVSREDAAEGQYAVLRSSADGGRSWSAARRIHAVAEPIAADGENRPKLAFGPQGEFYVTWTSPTSKQYTGDIRFTRSNDGALSWSPPVNVHHDSQRIGHRFDSLLVDPAGRLYVVWIDKRDLVKAQQQGLQYAGAALYYAVSEDGGARWNGDFKVADHVCECCRSSLVAGNDGAPIVMWRHVFAGGERDHAQRVLRPDGRLGPLQRATFDHWKVDACPHHGPALALGHDNGVPVRHAVWYTQQGEEGRVFYGRLEDGQAEAADGIIEGKVTGQRSLPAGAEHADIAASGSRVWIVWKSFDGEKTNIGLLKSSDGGLTWAEQIVSTTAGNSAHPHLLQVADQAWLAWNTAQQGPVVRLLP